LNRPTSPSPTSHPDASPSPPPPPAPKPFCVPSPTSDQGWLIHGDNLAALHALSPTWDGAIQLAYLDPPYNTGQHFKLYDDALAHEQWRAFMRPRLAAITPLLTPTGVLVTQTDRNEQADLKLLLDEALGRSAYVTTIAVRMSATSGFKIRHTQKTIVKNTEYLHIYARDLRLHARIYEENFGYDDHYNSLLLPPTTPDAPWTFCKLAHAPPIATLLTRHDLPLLDASLPTLYSRDPDFRAWVAAHADHICRSHTAPPGARADFAAHTLFPPDLPALALVQRSYLDQPYWLRQTRHGVDQLIPLSLKLRPVDTPNAPDRVALTNILGDWWDGFHLDMGNVEVEGHTPFKNGKKPERLLRRLLSMFTLPHDWVLDPFAGSGTTGAAAHKMHRRWLMIERGPQCLSHIAPRLASITAGLDPTGITRATHWTGGGDFQILSLPDTP
jgi:adenine-specific DNA-methyltransferase